MSDINTAAVDSLKVLDPKRPIREADMCSALGDVRFVPFATIAPQNSQRKKKDRHAAVLPKSDQMILLGRDSSALPLLAPAEQTQSAEAGGEEWEGGW